MVLYCGIVTAFNFAYLIVNDLFPTIFLATAYGGCNIVGRLVTVSSPLIARAKDPWPLMILAVYSGICVVVPLMLVPLKKAG